MTPCFLRAMGSRYTDRSESRKPSRNAASRIMRVTHTEHDKERYRPIRHGIRNESRTCSRQTLYSKSRRMLSGRLYTDDRPPSQAHRVVRGVSHRSDQRARRRDARQCSPFPLFAVSIMHGTHGIDLAKRIPPSVTYAWGVTQSSP